MLRVSLQIQLNRTLLFSSLAYSMFTKDHFSDLVSLRTPVMTHTVMISTEEQFIITSGTTSYSRTLTTRTSLGP